MNENVNVIDHISAYNLNPERQSLPELRRM